MKDRLRTSFKELMHFEVDMAAGFQPPAEPAVEPVVEPAEPAWGGPSQEEWLGLQQTIGYLAQQFQPEPEPMGAQYGGLDPFAENFAEQLAALVGQTVQAQTAPLSEWQYGQQLAEAHDRAFDIIADDVSRNGEFMLGENAYNAVEALANSYMAEEAQRHGYGPKAAESALTRAAKDWRQYESDLRQKAIEQHMNQLSTLGGAPREPFPAGAAASTGLRGQPGGDELSVVSQFGGFPGRPT